MGWSVGSDWNWSWTQERWNKSIHMLSYYNDTGSAKSLNSCYLRLASGDSSFASGASGKSFAAQAYIYDSSGNQITSNTVTVTKVASATTDSSGNKYPTDSACSQYTFTFSSAPVLAAGSTTKIYFWFNGSGVLCARNRNSSSTYGGTVSAASHTLTLIGDEGVQSMSGAGTYTHGAGATVSVTCKPGYVLKSYYGTTADGSSNSTWTSAAGKKSDTDTWYMNANRTIYVYTTFQGCYVYTGGAWKKAVPYVYTGGAWKETVPYVYKDGAWKVGTG